MNIEGDRYHIAKWNNPNEQYTEPSDLTQFSVLCFMDKAKAIAKCKLLRKSNPQWSVIRQRRGGDIYGEQFIPDIY